MKSIYELVGATIKQVRIEQNISSKALARYINQPYSTIDDIEAGTASITLHMLYAIAAALNCKPTVFLPDPVAVSIPKQGRGVSVAIEQAVEQALVGDDPHACKRWITNLIADAVLVNLESKSQ